MINADCCFFAAGRGGEAAARCLLRQSPGSCPCEGCGRFLSRAEGLRILKEYIEYDDQLVEDVIQRHLLRGDSIRGIL